MIHVSALQQDSFEYLLMRSFLHKTDLLQCDVCPYK